MILLWLITLIVTLFLWNLLHGFHTNILCMVFYGHGTNIIILRIINLGFKETTYFFYFML